ncbi:parathyroid hormone 2 receptor-like, partial [Limulus polyphemus]|uniref:Parathyroid hormone 2 receptor-like n=1 Tax=Limulus polyphemus TaxID=6850 RepID=A0ABM1RV28_LIMPO
VELPGEEHYSRKYMDQQARLEEKRLQCEAKITTNFPRDEELYCPMMWDGAICWPYIPAGTLYEIPCPAYVHGFNTDAFASKLCTSDGTWWINKDRNKTWTNYSMCVTRHIDLQGEPEDSEINMYIDGFFECDMLYKVTLSSNLET